MMRPSKNAFKGYSYQKSVYTYFVLKMDIEREIQTIEAEIKPNNHNFDDIMVTTSRNKYYIQTKNYDSINTINVKENGIEINGKLSVKSNKGINIFILKKGKESIQSNNSIFGLDAYYENGIYVIVADTEELFENINSQYKNNIRFYQMIDTADKFASQNNNYITKEDLPEYKFYSNQLMEQTIKLRNFNIDNNMFYCIVGKPGVGKSHLVNELDIPNSCLYRFWISEQDQNRNDRLQYENFIEEISYKVFENFVKHTEDEIIEEIFNNKTTLIIDGLDHVENYNNIQFERFIDFIEKVRKRKDIRLIILTRPLKKEIGWETTILENWTKDETNEFIRQKYNICDYAIIEKIFEIADGYPIITDFVANHYNINKEIPEINKVENINNYYEQLISNVDMQKILSVFTLTKGYLTFYELSKLFSKFEMDLIKDFIKTHKYLFDIRLNRIALIHDSLNTYFISKFGKNEELNNKLIAYIKKSIENEELRFLVRINNFELNIEYKEQILKKYAKFDEFRKLRINNIDIEAVMDFYFQLKKILVNSKSESIFDIYQYYEFILILCICVRDNLGGSYALIYEQLKYYKRNNIQIIDNLYSEKNLFYIYYTLKTEDINLFSKKLEDELHDSTRELSDMYEEIDKELNFFDSENQGINLEEIEKKIDRSEVDSYSKHMIISEILTKSFINNIKYKDYYNIINNYINGDKEKAKRKLEKIFKKFKIDTFMANWSLNKAKERIFQMGLCREKNPYIILNLSDFIQKNKLRGSFSLRDMITAYIRLAIRENRTIDINSLNKYYCMYYNRKDYTVYTLPDALKIFYDLGIIDLEECINIIHNAQEMSEKGIRHILYEFINMLKKEDIQNLKGKDFFSNDSIYKIWINDLNCDIIECMDEDYVIEQLGNVLSRHIRSQLIDFYEINNIMKTKYKDFVLLFLQHWRIKLYDVPEDFKNDGYNINIEYKEKEGKYIIGEHFRKGYLDDEDYEYIKSTGISHIELSKYLDGWHSKFSVISLYDMFEKEILRVDLLKIIYTTLKYGKTDIQYDGDYNHYLGNIPKFLYRIDYKVEWKKIYNIMKEFLNISLII